MPCKSFRGSCSFFLRPARSLPASSLLPPSPRPDRPGPTLRWRMVRPNCVWSLPSPASFIHSLACLPASIGGGSSGGGGDGDGGGGGGGGAGGGGRPRDFGLSSGMSWAPTAVTVVPTRKPAAHTTARRNLIDAARASLSVAGALLSGCSSSSHSIGSDSSIVTNSRSSLSRVLRSLARRDTPSSLTRRTKREAELLVALGISRLGSTADQTARPAPRSDPRARSRPVARRKVRRALAGT